MIIILLVSGIGMYMPAQQIINRRLIIGLSYFSNNMEDITATGNKYMDAAVMIIPAATMQIIIGASDTLKLSYKEALKRQAAIIFA